MAVRAPTLVLVACAATIAHADPNTAEPDAAETEATRSPTLYSRLALTARYTSTSSSASGALADSDLDILAIDGSSRFAIGWPYALCAGVDATLGASSTGMAYGADLYPIGLVLPFRGFGGRRGRMSACGGFGLSGVRGSIPFGWELAGEASLEMPVGPIDARISGKATLIANADERRDGTDAMAGFADESSGAIEARIGHGGRILGGDPTIGMMWQEAMGADFYGFFVGIAASRSAFGR